MSQTIAEKLFSRNNLARTPAHAGDIVEARIDGAMCHYHAAEPMHDLALQAGFKDGLPRVWDPDTRLRALDHHQPTLSQKQADENALIRQEVESSRHPVLSRCRTRHLASDDGRLRADAPRRARRRQRFAYDQLRRAQCGGAGITRADMFYVLLFGELWFQVPHDRSRWCSTGASANYPIAKDIILYLAGKYGDDFAGNMSIEYAGSLVPRAQHRQPHVPVRAWRRSRREIRDVSRSTRRRANS